jgi:uracil-DNA glycosylase
MESSTTRQIDRLCPDWRDTFDTRNVWPYARTRDDKIDVNALIAKGRYEVVVALGFTVSRELGVSQTARWLSWHERDGISILKLPHPSGANRWWNDPAHRALASMALAQAIHHCPVS